MNNTLKLALQILGVIDFVMGAAVVVAARSIVNKYKLNEKSNCEFENEMTEEELYNYKVNKAVVNTKMIGMALALPGLILILYAFK